MQRPPIAGMLSRVCPSLRHAVEGKRLRLFTVSVISSHATCSARLRGSQVALRLSSLRRRHTLAGHLRAAVPPTHPSMSAVRGVSAWAVPSSIFVRFQPTPNDACYKFYVDDMTFLPPGSHTMMFDSTNSYQSPLAHALLESLPMVEEVTIGSSFVTVRRVEEADAKAAAKYFAMRFHGVHSAADVDDADAAAARSQALQQHVEDVRHDAATGSHGSAPTAASATQAQTSSASAFAAEAPIEMGGFTVSPSAQDEQIDEEALQALISATDWAELKFHVSALLTDHISSGSPHVDPNAPNPHADTVPEAGDSEVVLMIKELVATTIRPQLQDDGGDLRFVGFDAGSGEMCVELLGACRTCKSSKTTLVDLIERTTRHWIPEVTTVKDVSRIVSVYHRFAEEAADEVEGSPSVSEMLRDMQGPQDGGSGADGDAAEPEASATVQFAASSGTSAAGGSFRVVREVKANATAENPGACATPAAAAVS